MDDHNTQRNYYEILEIPIDASPDEVHHGYMRAKNAYSQDSIALYSLMSAEECQNLVQLIDEAYSIISDPHKRRQYDHARGLKDHSNEPEVKRSHSHHDEGDDLLIKQNPDTSKNSMSKIVAVKKFALAYEHDPDFEQEIEQTQDFSGPFLKKIREYKNMDIPRLSDLTRISKTHIVNIEDENFASLPAQVYVRGFVYQMAKCLKLNPDLVANSYLYRLKRVKDNV
jgi:curved DNA-binding protein CbpA